MNQEEVKRIDTKSCCEPGNPTIFLGNLALFLGLHFRAGSIGGELCDIL